MVTERGGEAGQQGSQSQSCCFQEWIELQKTELDELVEALSIDNNTNTNNSNNNNNGTVLSPDGYSRLVEKCLTHYKEYKDKRTMLANDGVSPFFSPHWNTSFENSLLWIAGCRPSLCIRLVYTLCGSQIESQLASFVQGADVRVSNDEDTMADLSAEQLVMINNFHRKILWNEERLTNKLASVQEEIADKPLALIAQQANRVGEPSREVDEAIRAHENSMKSIMREADDLRLSTIQELTTILKPRQAVDFLAAAKKLHLCVHAWGKEMQNNSQATTNNSNNTTP